MKPDDPSLNDGFSGTPRQLGFWMPAEWAPHLATWMVWPTNRETWADIPAIEQCFRTLIRELLTGERVNLLVDNSDEEVRILDFLGLSPENAQRLSVYQVPTGDVWIRDYGPNFLVHRHKSTLAYNDWQFNAWGNKYTDLRRDNQVTPALELQLQSFRPGVVLEGGSVEVNGQGLCLTTKSCLLSERRNPGASPFTMEKILSDYLGISRTIWLEGQLAGDDTDGHVDQMARFVNPDTVACVATAHGASDADWTVENIKRLRQADLNILLLPLPSLEPGLEGAVPASYANFYIANEKVLVPTFGVAQDGPALKQLQKAFSDRKVIGIECRALIRGLGAIHCVTQQQPETAPP